MNSEPSRKSTERIKGTEWHGPWECPAPEKNGKAEVFPRLFQHGDAGLFDDKEQIEALTGVRI
jgi:hypothetical protein